MARVSRKNRKEETAVISLKEYRCGSYARLSVVKRNRGSEDSIEHQLLRNRNFIAQNIENSILAKEYSDNGVTGTTFDRPGFTDLLNDIKAGKINCVVVKDFSRFGRDMLEALELLDVVFPELNVRFISIDDAYDSEDPRCSKERMVYVMKHLANEYYVRVVSKKLTQAHQMARGNGEFWGARPQYGFERSKESSKKLIVDKEAASVLVRAYHMFVLDGVSYHAIAKIYNEEGIPSPEAYYLIKHGKKEEVDRQPNKYIWTSSIIAKLIQSPANIGCLVTHKTEQSYYKNQKQRRVPRSEWCIEENALPRIISQTIYDEAQRLAKELWIWQKKQFEPNPNRTEGIYRGKVMCGKCGRSMSAKTYFSTSKEGIKEGIEYSCPGHISAPSICGSRCVNEKSITGTVTTLLEKWIQVAAEGKKSYKKDMFIKRLEKEYQKQIISINEEIYSLSVRVQNLYEDYAEGILDKREYLEFKKRYMNQKNNAIEKKSEITVEKYNLIRRYSLKAKWMSKLLSNKGSLLINAELVDELIDKIIIFDKDYVEISFKIADLFSVETVCEKAV